ncbi:uncharacterized protein LOC114348879 [Diabrotica virgifera virgifera]|uniref:Uncharacterized protein n=1 Tax=Diabrotica virgifera virgifera TaxID=50390 RepID=A0ABM5K2F0_DIAVI|nr:uncharacterized protein LOC114348879 [Diabrotica virgifera virgifera]
MTKLIMVFIAVFGAVLVETAENQRYKQIKTAGDALRTCMRNLGDLPLYVYEHGAYKNIKEEDKDHIGEVYLCVYTKLGIMTEDGDLIDDKLHTFFINLLGDAKPDRDSRKETIEKILKTCKPSQCLVPKIKAFSYERCIRNDIFY